jgi:hypothetical protein
MLQEALIGAHWSVLRGRFAAPQDEGAGFWVRLSVVPCIVVVVPYMSFRVPDVVSSLRAPQTSVAVPYCLYPVVSQGMPSRCGISISGDGLPYLSTIGLGQRGSCDEQGHSNRSQDPDHVVLFLAQARAARGKTAYCER